MFLFFSCSRTKSLQVQNLTGEAVYRTSFAATNISAELTTVLNSVKKITNYTSYRTYIFDDNSRITLNDLNSENLLERTSAGIVNNDVTAGTALIVFSDGKQIAMLTCAHAVKAPDTIIQWNEYRDLNNNQFIQSISIKIKQQLYVRDMPEGFKFKILAIDTNNDIAIIGSENNNPAKGIPVFKYPCGNSLDLKWGSFLYLAGYPTGQQMVSHGIVSTLPDKAGYFLTDALFNEGFSGGIALAITEDGGDFELVGMARSVAGSYNYVLKPEKENHEFIYNPAIPYTGSVYVNQKKEINYGVTYVISINQIRQFYSENRLHLLQAGYNLDEFFGLDAKKD
jgi:hypothetical protein